VAGDGRRRDRDLRGAEERPLSFGSPSLGTRVARLAVSVLSSDFGPGVVFLCDE
jgi:hypothetical protein